MEIQNKMTVAKALFNYAKSQGYTGKIGKQKYTDRQRSCINSVAKEFNFSVNIVFKLFSMNERLIDNISESTFFHIIRVLAKKDIDIDEIFTFHYPSYYKDRYSETLENPTKDSPEDPLFRFLRDLPESSDIELYDINTPTVEDMSIKRTMTPFNYAKSQGYTGELPTDIHVSNRLYSVEGKFKEIADFAIQHKKYFTALKESWLTAHPLGPDSLDPENLKVTQMLSYLHEAINGFDTIITKLDNI